MSTTEIKTLLLNHGIDCAVTSDGEVLACDSWPDDGQISFRVINVTNWSHSELMSWLGY